MLRDLITIISKIKLVERDLNPQVGVKPRQVNSLVLFQLRDPPLLSIIRTFSRAIKILLTFFYFKLIVPFFLTERFTALKADYVYILLRFTMIACMSALTLYL